LCRWIVVLQVRLDGFVLLVEKREIRDKIFHDVHCSACVLCRVGEVGVRAEMGNGNGGWPTMWEWVNLGVFPGIPVDATQACERVLPVDIHRAGATDTLPTGAAKSERRVNFIFNFDERVQDLVV